MKESATTNIIEIILWKAKELDWIVNITENSEENLTFEFKKHSPAGKDFSFCADMVNGNVHSLLDNIYNRYNDYDCSSETYLYLDKNGHGIDGLPYDMRDVYDYIEAFLEMMAELYDSLNEINWYKFENYYTWDYIYKAADGAGFGDDELKRKDTARFEVICFIEDNFGINLEKECLNNLIDCVEDYIDEYVKNYSIFFTKEGKISEHKIVTLKDKAHELIEFHDLFVKNDREHDILNIAINIIKELENS